MYKFIIFIIILIQLQKICAENIFPLENKNPVIKILENNIKNYGAILIESGRNKITHGIRTWGWNGDGWGYKYGYYEKFHTTLESCVLVPSPVEIIGQLDCPSINDGPCERELVKKKKKSTIKKGTLKLGGSIGMAKALTINLEGEYTKETTEEIELITEDKFVFKINPGKMCQINIAYAILDCKGVTYKETGVQKYAWNKGWWIDNQEYTKPYDNKISQIFKQPLTNVALSANKCLDINNIDTKNEIDNNPKQITFFNKYLKKCSTETEMKNCTTCIQDIRKKIKEVENLKKKKGYENACKSSLSMCEAMIRDCKTRCKDCPFSVPKNCGSCKV